MKKLFRRIVSIVIIGIMLFTSVPALEINVSAAEDYRSWSQSDSRWGSLSLGSGTMSGIGCLVTSMAKMMNQGKITDASWTPGSMRNWLVSNNQIDTGGAVKSYYYLTNFSSYLSYHGMVTLSGNWNTDNSTLMNYVYQGYQIILQVYGGAASGYHFVLVDNNLSSSNGDVYIMDSSSYIPYNTGKRPCDRYAKATKCVLYKSSAVNSWKNSATKANLGDSFYAKIVNPASGKALAVGTDNNVVIKSLSDSNDQLWRFTKNSDGTYKIVNLSNNKALDVSNASAAPETNLLTYDDNGTAAQRWSLYSAQGEYVLSANCTDCVADIYNAGTSDGTNVLMYTKHEGVNQLFAVEKIYSPSKPSLSVSGSGTYTAFQWKNDSNATSYDLKILKDGSVYKTVTGVKYTSVELLGMNVFTLDLPNGIYSAILTANNRVYSVASETVTFTVNNNADENNWKYATSLPSGITSDKYEIEYRHTYKTVSKTSPGTEWVKGEVAKTEYVNKGEVYYSTLPLETSNTRALVDYSYYHYCSGSKGDEVNYEATNVFNHYDGINKDNVYEFYSHADYADSRYTFYGLKYKSNNALVYCCSGTTCDGSFGSHGNRSYYWYKVYAYQDKEAVNYYTYTKQGGWTDKKDSSASSFEVRYREIENSSEKENKISSATLSTVNYIYDGKNKTPKVTIKDTEGNTLVKNVDYKITVSSKRSAIGRHTVKLTFIGDYEGSMNLYFYIKPGKTASVKSASQTTSSVTLKWSEVEGAAGYTVYRYSPSKKAYVKAGTTEGTSLTVNNLYAGTKYTFKVVAYGKTSAGKVYNSDSYTLLKTATKSKTPELTKVTASSTKGKAYVYHSDVSGETGYTVYYSTDKSSGFKKYANFSADTTRCDITGLTSGKTYYFKVRTYIKTNSGYVYSSWSTVKGVKVK